MLRQILILTILILTTTGRAGTKSSGQHWQPIGKEGEAFDSMMERAAFLDMPRRDLVSLLLRFPERPHTSDARQQEARMAYWKAWVLAKENPDSALRLSEMSMSLCDSSRYPYDYARFSIMKADFMRTRGLLADAYFIMRDKINILRDSGDRFWTAKTLVLLGAVMQELGEFHEALRYYSEAQQAFNEIDSHACSVKNRINIANINYMLGLKQTAVKWIDNLESNRFVTADSVYMANLLVSRFHISEYADRRAALKAYEIGRRLNNDHLSVLTLLSMGILSCDGQNFTAGRKYLLEALAVTYRIDDLPNRRRILERLENYCTAAGDSAVARKYRTALLEVNDSLYNHERIDKMRKTEHLATINRYETKIRKAEQQRRWQLVMAVSAGGVLAVILGLSLWIVWVSRRKAEGDRRLEEEKNRRLELINKQYALEIEAKEKELASNTMLMSQKNSQLKELSAQIERMERKGDIPQSNSDTLKNTIDRQLNADDDWRYFKLRFEKVHPDFFPALAQKHPGLSKTDQRLCAYIRVGMSAKEISQILSVKPETVNTSRYRIRKKMQLPADVTLESALEQIS